MIVHVVSLKWAGGVGEEEIAMVERALDGLAELPGVESLVRGPNLGFNPRTAATCDYGFVVRLTDAAAMRAYMDHPRHLELGERLAPLLAGLMSLQLEDPGEPSST